MNYFIFYQFESGYGNTDVETSWPIESINDIRRIESEIEEKNGFSSVVIVSFQRFEEDE